MPLIKTAVERIGGKDRVTMSYGNQSFLVGTCDTPELMKFTKEMLDIMLDCYEKELINKAVKISNDLAISVRQHRQN